MSTFFAAISSTSFRTSASVVTQKGACERPGSGPVMPRPAVRYRATLGIVSARTWYTSSPVSWPRLIVAPAATNVDLEKAMKEGRFRQDLYFRLNVIRIHMPKLAERREDIPLLVAEFIKKYGHIRSGAYPPVQGVTPEVRQIFASYDWPGNVRELENVIEAAIALGTSTYIGREELPLSVTLKAPEPAELGQWVTQLNACKKTIIERALQKTSLNRAEAARLLDLNPKYFSALCKELHLK